MDPALNEAQCLASTLRALRAMPGDFDVLVVDGGSSDDTVRIARDHGGPRLLAAHGARRAAGYHLQRAGLRFAILEAGASAGGSWRHYYDSLVLFSPAEYSALPGLPFPGDPDHYPHRDEVVGYLAAYADRFALPVATGARILAVERDGPLFRVSSSAGAALRAQALIAATGSFGNPFIPELPGQADYRGRLLHAFDYREPSPFAGERVVVVGGANSAVQIGVELAKVARVTLALRSPIVWMPQRVLGKDGHFWLRISGLDYSRLLSDQSTPVVDAGRYRAAVAAGRPDTRRMFERLSERGVVWKTRADGAVEEEVDTVLLATGYRPNLDYLRGLGALDAAGLPRQRDGVSTAVAGLYYVGLSGQRNFASATLRGVGPDASKVVGHLLGRRRAAA